MVATLQELSYQTDGNGQMPLLRETLDLPTNRLARRVAEQAKDRRPVFHLEESEYVAVVQERGDAPFLVADPQYEWQPKALINKGWPIFLSAYSSYGSSHEKLHKHSATNPDGEPDQVEV